MGNFPKSTMGTKQIAKRLITAAETSLHGFTPEQQIEIDLVLGRLVADCVEAINAHAGRIKEMDKRPKQTYTKEQPAVFMPYVAQGMLEELIGRLQEGV